MADQDQDDIQLPAGYGEVELPKSYRTPAASPQAQPVEIDPRKLPPPGVPRPLVNVRPISMGEALGVVSSKDVEDAEKHGLQHYATDAEVDQRARNTMVGLSPESKKALKMSDTLEHNFGVGPMTGAAKEATRTLGGVSRIAQRAKSKITGTDPRTKTQMIENVDPHDVGIFGEQITPEETAAADTSELIGGIGENVGEYMLGGRLLRAAPYVGGLLDAGSKAKLPLRMLTSGIENAALSGGQDYIKSGGDPSEATHGAEVGGIAGAGGEMLGAGFNQLGKSLSKNRMRFGTKIENEVAKNSRVGSNLIADQIEDSLASMGAKLPKEAPLTPAQKTSKEFDRALTMRDAPTISEAQKGVNFDKSDLADNWKHIQMEDGAGKMAGWGQYKINGDVAKLTGTNVVEGSKGNGLGKKLYMETAKNAAEDGARTLMSDDNVSPEADHVWKSLMRDNPEAIQEQNGRYRWDLTKMKDETGPVMSKVEDQTQKVLDSFQELTPRKQIFNITPEEIEKGAQSEAQKLRWQQTWRLAGRLAVTAGVEIGAWKTINDIPVVRESPTAKAVILIGLLGIQTPALKRQFIKAIAENPSLIKKVLLPMQAGEKISGISERLVRGAGIKGYVNSNVPTLSLPAGYGDSEQ